MEKFSVGSQEYYFPSRDKASSEQIQMVVRRHPISYFFYLLLLLLLYVLPLIALAVLNPGLNGALLNYPTKNILIVVGTAYYLITTLIIFVEWMDRYFDLLMVTSKSIIYSRQSGFLQRKMVYLHLAQIEDITTSISGILATLFAFGDIVIHTAGAGSDTIIIHNVPNPQETASKIMRFHKRFIDKLPRSNPQSNGKEKPRFHYASPED